MMKKQNMRKLLFISSFLKAAVIFSQEGGFMNQLQIKSPQTYAFEKYGNVPVNLYTGMIDMRIPFYSLDIDGDNSVNVLLSYDSSGFIPHKKGDLGGIGWSLIAGGRISRRSGQRRRHARRRADLWQDRSRRARYLVGRLSRNA